MKRLLFSSLILGLFAWVSPLLAEDIRYPADANITDLRRDYGAKGDGTTDDTAAIQKALLDGKRTIYFPNGTYLVSAKLEWRRSNRGTTSRQLFQGQSTDGTVIKLKDGAAGFQDPANPREIIWTGASPAQSFQNGLRNLTLDSGKGNPGAIGTRFYANNQGGIRDVHIRSGDGKGVIGLDLGHTNDQGPMLIRNIRVTGFDTGIRTTHPTAGVVAEFISLKSQNVVGWLNVDQPVSLRGFTSTNTVPALENRGNTLITLLDATLTGQAATGPAIINDTGLFVRNLSTIGYTQAIGGKCSAEGMNVAEWISHPPLSLFPSPPRPLNLPVRETPEVPWDAPDTWVSVAKFAPTPDVEMKLQADRTKKLPDWTAAFQRAIDSGATTVYFPTGSYTFNGTVKVRGNVRRIVGLGSSFGNQVGGCVIVVENGTAPVVVIEDFDWMYSNIRIRHTGQRELVLRSLAGGQHRGMAVSVVAEKGHGGLFIEDVTLKCWHFHGGKVWARQINPEGGYTDFPTTPRGTFDADYDMILNDGATLWIWGLKSEGDGTVITTTNGGKTEVCGFIYANKAYRPEKQWIVNDNSSVSVSIVENVLRNAPFDPILEKRGNETRILKKGTAPERGGGGSLVVLYTGYQGTATQPPAAPKNVTTRNLTSSGVTPACDTPPSEPR